MRHTHTVACALSIDAITDRHPNSGRNDRFNSVSVYLSGDATTPLAMECTPGITAPSQGAQMEVYCPDGIAGAKYLTLQRKSGDYL